MKKQLIFLILVILMLSLTGCKKSDFAISSDEKNLTILAKNASKDMFGATSGFEISEGEKLYIDPTLTKGEISVKLTLFDLDMGSSVQDLTDAVSGKNADMEIKISGNDPSEYDLEPGSYSVYASVLSKADGTIVMSVR